MGDWGDETVILRKSIVSEPYEPSRLEIDERLAINMALCKESGNVLHGSSELLRLHIMTGNVKYQEAFSRWFVLENSRCREDLIKEKLKEG